MQHSLWADTTEDEAQIYFQFLNILKAVEKPSLIHYGSFETDFFKQMGTRYGVSVQNTLENNGNQAPTNLLSIINGQVYFPTYSNGLKEYCSLAWLRMVRYFTDRRKIYRLPLRLGGLAQREK